MYTSNKLVRFDWAIKRLLRNKAYYCIVEGLLTALLNRKIVIKSLLESEGNKESDTDKFNRVDLLAEDENEELYIFEIQNNRKLVSNPDLEDVAYSVITHDKDNNKTEIEIDLKQCLSVGDVKELPTMFTKETSNKKASYTCFEGGHIIVDIKKMIA